MARELYLLVFNAGSSSVKLEVFAVAHPTSVWRATVAGVGREHSQLRVAGGVDARVASVVNHRAAAELLLDQLEGGALDTPVAAANVAATAHRVVHGGEEFTAPAVVDEAVLRRLQALEELAPLHNPAALAVMRLVRERYPAAPMAAVFDTAFYADLPEAARTYALPAPLRRRHRIRRYGFHGIAHESLYRGYCELAPARGGSSRVVSLQLGQGCSATALLDGRPVETSMGYTPLEGLIMGTRCGDLDPGVLLALARAGESPRKIETMLQLDSGLRGLSGTSDDMRELLEREAAGDRAAAAAIAAFCHRAVKYLGAYSAVLGGVDAVLFGGGIGENSPAIRARICAGFAWLGLKLDDQANHDCRGTRQSIAAADSPIGVYVIPVREEALIAGAARALLALG